QRVNNPARNPSRIDFEGFFSTAVSKPGKSCPLSESKILSHSFGRIRAFAEDNFSSNSARENLGSSELVLAASAFVRSESWLDTRDVPWLSWDCEGVESWEVAPARCPSQYPPPRAANATSTMPITPFAFIICPLLKSLEYREPRKT